MISQAGAALPDTGPGAAALALALAYLLQNSGLGTPAWNASLAVLHHHPFQDGQRHTWFWQREARWRWIIPALAGLTAVLWLAMRTDLLTALAGAAGWMNAGAVLALLRYFRGSVSHVLRLLVLLAAAAGFSDSLAALRPLNPVYWPLLAIEAGVTVTGGLALAGAVLFPVAVRVLVRQQARNISARFTAPAPEDERGESAESAPAAAPDGFWERLIARTRTPQQQVLAEMADCPGGRTLGRIFAMHAPLAAALLMAGILLAPWLQKVGFSGKDPERFHIFLPLIPVLVSCFAILFPEKARDGFPFQRLMALHQMPDGQRVLPVALLPVGIRTVWFLWLKSLWPRMLVAVALLTGAALVSGWYVLGRDAGLHLAAAALICTPLWLGVAQVRFCWGLLEAGTAWRRFSLRWALCGLAIIFGTVGVIAAFGQFVNHLPGQALTWPSGDFALHVLLLSSPMFLGALLMAAVYRFARPDLWTK